MLNVSIIMGNLVFDPEIKTTNTGKEVCNFRVAVQRPNKEKTVDYIDCIAWGNKARFVNSYFHKGSMIALQGSIQTRKYEDKHGNNRTAFEVIAEQVSFCGGKSGDKPQQASPHGNFEQIDSDDELPF